MGTDAEVADEDDLRIRESEEPIKLLEGSNKEDEGEAASFCCADLVRIDNNDS